MACLDPEAPCLRLICNTGHLCEQTLDLFFTKYRFISSSGSMSMTFSEPRRAAQLFAATSRLAVPWRLPEGVQRGVDLLVLLVTVGVCLIAPVSPG